MKVRILHRDERLYKAVEAGTKRGDYRSLDVRQHPLQTVREYQRALVATKMERMFAKPFAHAFSGHLDSVKSLGICHKHVADFFSGSCDGELRFWNLTNKKCLRSVHKAHEGFINMTKSMKRRRHDCSMMQGICVSLDDKYVYTCGSDRKVKAWAMEKYFNVLNVNEDRVTEVGNLVTDSNFVGTDLEKSTISPVLTYLAPSPLTSVDHHDEKSLLVTSGEKVWLWDENRSHPVHEFSWGLDSFYSTKWNRSECNLFLATAGDNTVALFDVREKEGVQRLQLNMRSNASCWNPHKPFNFSVANEDGNLYTFDMRNFQQALRIHHGHVKPVLDLDYSATGKEIVAGSFDQTVRIWRENESTSRDTYYNKRMQIVLSTRFTGDSKFVLSGSSDLSIRLWKSNSAEIMGPVSRREREAVEYREALKSKFGEMPELKKMSRHRHLPKYIKNQTKLRQEKTAKETRKEKNRVERNPILAEHKTLKTSMVRNVEVIPTTQ